MPAAIAPVRLIPHAELTGLVTEVMDRREYLSLEPSLTRTEQGWARRPLPPDQGLRLSDFLDAIATLPDPAPEPDAAAAIIMVLRARGHWFLASELDDGWAARWPAPAGDAARGDPDEPAPGDLPPRHCANCGQRYRPRRLRSVYCGQACRQQAYRRRQLARALWQAVPVASPASRQLPPDLRSVR
jgi:hypothetical protein